MGITTSIAVDNVNINNPSGKSSGDDIDWWPMFRHDPQHSGYSTSKAPDTNNVLWSYTIDDEMSSPTVADGRVYFGSDDEWVYCLDAISGDYIWVYPTWGSVVSSPAVADGKVYVGSNDENVYFLDAISGDLIWNYTTNWHVHSSPTVADGNVYINSDFYVYCLDADNGGYIWSYNPEGFYPSSPTVADGKVYFGECSITNIRDGRVYCLDANTGAKIWRFDTGDWGTSSAAVADDRVYICSYCYHYWEGNGDVFCLDANTGAKIWRYTLGKGGGSPAVADGKIYIRSNDFDSDNGTVYCLDANTGNLIWSYTLGDKVSSNPAVADGKVYIGFEDGNLYCLNASNGDYIWNYTTGDEVSSPVVADGKVYAGSDDGNIYAFGELDPDAPSAPKINGPKRGALGILYNFTFKSESPLGNDLYYWIEWADGNNSGWLGPYCSGVEITESHVWNSKGKCRIQAKAKDTNGSVSRWSIYKLRIPRNRAIVNSLFHLFFDRFPLLEVFLRAMDLLR